MRIRNGVDEAPIRRHLRTAGRAVVCLIGGVAAFANAVVVNYYYGRHVVLGYTEIIVSIGLLLAAPACFFLGTFGKAGDRWTAGYVLAWVVYMSVIVLAVIIARAI